ncbi:MAG: SGNH/GDSL hydrolase family protein [Phycisphaerae bacterium]|nr:SGNH/GDSL hydrolase family protein [Phycisphaerae bacterium]
MNTKKIKTLALSTTSMLILLLTFTGCGKPKTYKPLNILFIGNSYTYYGDLPEVITQMALAKGRIIHHQQQTPGGKSLAEHWQMGKAAQLIDSGNWDIVVLQDQSSMPAVKPEETQKYAKLFCDKIHAIGATPMFYLTPAYHAPRSDPIPDMQAKLAKTYIQVAKENNALIAPIGLAWQAAYKHNPDYPLHTQDNSHPAALGVYLNGLVFYAAIYNEKPENMITEMKVVKDGKEQIIRWDINNKTRRQLETYTWQAMQNLAIQTNQ